MQNSAAAADNFTHTPEKAGLGTIYHLLDEAEPFSEIDGGAISRWAANVLRDGDEIVVCPDFDSSWNFSERRVYKLPQWRRTDPIHPLLYRMPWTLQRLFYLKIFAPLLQRTKPGDIIYVHNRPECASVLATVQKRYDITVILHMHNSHMTAAKRQQLQALQQCPIVFCSQYLQREIEAKFPGHFGNSFVVYNGADVERFFPAPPSTTRPVTIVYCGRLVKYKGAHVLMKAMRILQDRGLDVRCKIIGGSWFGQSRTTQYMRSLRRMQPKNTDLMGYKSGLALAEELRTADIFCCPSIWHDPFPLAPIEAMASGLVVVASEVGGIPEALQHGGGVMVPPNDPVALADALHFVAENQSYRDRLREEGILAANSRFQWSNVRKQYEEVIAQVSA